MATEHNIKVYRPKRQSYTVTVGDISEEGMSIETAKEYAFNELANQGYTDSEAEDIIDNLFDKYI